MLKEFQEMHASIIKAYPCTLGLTKYLISTGATSCSPDEPRPLILMLSSLSPVCASLPFGCKPIAMQPKSEHGRLISHFRTLIFNQIPFLSSIISVRPTLLDILKLVLYHMIELAQAGNINQDTRLSLLPKGLFQFYRHTTHTLLLQYMYFFSAYFLTQTTGFLP